MKIYENHCEPLRTIKNLWKSIRIYENHQELVGNYTDRMNTVTLSVHVCQGLITRVIQDIPLLVVSFCLGHVRSSQPRRQ